MNVCPPWIPQFFPFPLRCLPWPWDSVLWGLKCLPPPTWLLAETLPFPWVGGFRRQVSEQKTKDLHSSRRSDFTSTVMPGWPEWGSSDSCNWLPNDWVLLSSPLGVTRSGLSAEGLFKASLGLERGNGTILQPNRISWAVRRVGGVVFKATRHPCSFSREHRDTIKVSVHLGSGHIFVIV